ncbi:MAG TPA: cupin domain-containing protein [Anaerovoracaceae bacterium]|nr:cupin domain-containing protein [Anaerovoracaceae bacterium]
MKQLICFKDVEAAKQSGKNVMTVEAKAIITPAAQDAARTYGIEIQRSAMTQIGDLSGPLKLSEDGINAELIFALLKILAGKGLLSAFEPKEYESEKTLSGLKIVRGNTVKYRPFDTGSPSDKVFCREFINKEDGSTMRGGFITLEDSRFDWEGACEEIFYILEGILNIFVDGSAYAAQPGDTVFLPKGAKAVFRSEKMTKIFYTAC